MAYTDKVVAHAARQSDTTERMDELEQSLLRVAVLCREDPSVVALISDIFFRGQRR